VRVYLDTPTGPIEVAVQKKSILDALKEQFPGGRSEETGMTITEDGLVYNETENTAPLPAAEEEVEDRFAGLLD
jgi:hypothetical protein